MDFEHFKEIISNQYQVSTDEAMVELDRQHPDDMLMFELFDTGSVSVTIGERKFILTLKVEEEL